MYLLGRTGPWGAAQLALLLSTPALWVPQGPHQLPSQLPVHVRIPARLGPGTGQGISGWKKENFTVADPKT